MLENNPRNISARRNGLGLSAATFNRITLEEPNWYQWKVKVKQHHSNLGYWFLQQCNNPHFLCKPTIQQNVKKHCLHGTNLNRNKENSGKQRTPPSEENIEQVTSMLENNPRNLSARRNDLGLSAATFNKITLEELRWYP